MLEGRAHLEELQALLLKRMLEVVSTCAPPAQKPAQESLPAAPVKRLRLCVSQAPAAPAVNATSSAASNSVGATSSKQLPPAAACGSIAAGSAAISGQRPSRCSNSQPVSGSATSSAASSSVGAIGSSLRSPAAACGSSSVGRATVKDSAKDQLFRPLIGEKPARSSHSQPPAASNNKRHLHPSPCVQHAALLQELKEAPIKPVEQGEVTDLKNKLVKQAGKPPGRAKAKAKPPKTAKSRRTTTLRTLSPPRATEPVESFATAAPAPQSLQAAEIHFKRLRIVSARNPERSYVTGLAAPDYAARRLIVEVSRAAALDHLRIIQDISAAVERENLSKDDAVRLRTRILAECRCSP